MAQGCLETAIVRVVREIGQVYGEHLLGEKDAIIINSRVEIPCGMFDKLRFWDWLNCWDIAAALEIADRLVCVKLSLSIPLHKKDTNDRVTPLSNPLRRWRKEINKYREVKSDPEGL